MKKISNVPALEMLLTYQINDWDWDSNDEAERSGSEDEPEAPTQLELEDHVLQMDQEWTAR